MAIPPVTPPAADPGAQPPVVPPTPGAPATPPAPGAQPPAPPAPGAADADLENGWDQKTKDYIKNLRAEAASNRTGKKETDQKLKALEKTLKETLGIKDDEKPEDKIKDLSGKNDQLAFRAAVLEGALEHGIGNEGLEYFQFLVAKEVAALPDGEKISPEKLAAIAKEAKKVATRAPGSTTPLPPGGGAAPPAPGGAGQVTVDSFAAMSITEKSKLYNSNPTQYQELFDAAKKAKKL